MRRHPQREFDVPDARDEPWSRFIDDINSLLSTGTYTWAEPVLRGIQHTVERTGCVTSGQRQALANIERGLWPGRRG